MFMLPPILFMTSCCVCSTKSTTFSIKLGSCIDYHVIISTLVFCDNNTVPLFPPSLCLTNSFGHGNEFCVVFKTGSFLRSLVNTSFFRRTLLHGVRWCCLAYTLVNVALLSIFNPFQSIVELISAVFCTVPGPISNSIITLFWRVLRPPLWSSGQSFWLQILPDFLSSSGSGTGSTQAREPGEVNWVATWMKKVAAPGLENRD